VVCACRSTGACLLLASVCALAAAAGRAAQTAEPGSKPNVLLITVDTLRADHLGSYGFPQETSAHIDALARDGVLFERAIAASGATAPSHASIMTSRYIRGHSVGYINGATRLEGARTLAEIFLDGGYATGAFVGNMVLRRGSGFERGFEVYDDELTVPEHNRSRVFERTAEQTTERALAWLGREETRDRPFFLWVHYQDPHGPYTPPSDYEKRFRTPSPPGEEKLPVLQNNTGWGGIPAYQLIDDQRLPSDYRGRYAGEIAYMDHALGRLIDAVDSHSPGRETVVLVTADHGESLGENDRWFVHFYTTTPEIAHVPMILRAPGLAPARRSELVHHVDVMPTLLELAGLPVPDGARGIALGPHLRQARAPIPERILYCDRGPELSAYRANVFYRILGVDQAWRAQTPTPAPPQAPVWVKYRWQPDGSWKRVPDDAGPAPSVRDYYSRATPMVRTRRADRQMRDRLRALGYVTE
jgi:arylsulfatase A-like enzyme